jgi:NADPH2:quinone reductase
MIVNLGRREGNQMKAIQYERFGGPEVLQYVDVPDPVPQAGEVLVRTIGIGLNFPDIRERSGVYNQSETRVGGVTLPNVSGLAVTGRVVDVGDGVDHALIGQNVVAMLKVGGYAELAVAKASLTVPLADGVDPIQMAGIAAQGVCAYLLLQASTELRSGESILIHGAAGGVGGIAVQIAKSLGASPIIGTASRQSRRNFVESLGADVAIGYDDPAWPEQVREITKGRGVDVLIESIGGDVFEQNFRALADFGRYLLLGSTRGPGDPFAPRRLMTHSQALIGFYLPVFYSRPELIARGLDFLAGELAAVRLAPMVERVMPLRDAADAQRMLEDRSVHGVLVLDPAA